MNNSAQRMSPIFLNAIETTGTISEHGHFVLDFPLALPVGQQVRIIIMLLHKKHYVIRRLTKQVHPLHPPQHWMLKQQNHNNTLPSSCLLPDRHRAAFAGGCHVDSGQQHETAHNLQRLRNLRQDEEGQNR